MALGRGRQQAQHPARARLTQFKERNNAEFFDSAFRIAVGDTYSTPVSIYDSLGASHILTFTFTKTGVNAWNYSLAVPPGDSSLVGGIVTAGAMTFDGNGNLLTPAANLAGLSIPGLTD